jgi:hypothetical protein
VATNSYMMNRKKWARPQALLFSDNPGTLSQGMYIPTGDEFEDFIIISDHNRGELSFAKERIETRQRMINGTMRSYHIADKVGISTSWTRLPSRGFSSSPTFVNGVLQTTKVYKTPGTSTTPPQGLLGTVPEEFTADGGAGGADLLEWYESHPGPFWVFLSYDKFGESNVNRYTQVLQMYFSAFDYDVEKRGGGRNLGPNNNTSYDMWNVNLSLEEV